jgi:hypothetical protein
VHRNACQAYCPPAETSDESFGLQNMSEKQSQKSQFMVRFEQALNLRGNIQLHSKKWLLHR